MLEMLKEYGKFSLTRVLPTLGYLTFLVLSVYLAVTGKTWGHYDAFALATGSSAIVQGYNKWVNSKYNTSPGKAGKP